MYLLLSAILISILAVLLVRWPIETSLGLYAALLPFDSVLVAGEIGGIHLHVTWFAGAAACAILLLTSLTGRGLFRPPRAALWSSVFVLWAVLSSAWAFRPDVSTFRWPVLALLLSLYLAGTSTRIGDRELARIAWWSILGGIAASGIAVYQYSRGEYWMPKSVEEALSSQFTGTRATLTLLGEITDPNILAASLILPFSLALGILFSARGWLARTAAAAAVGALGACIALTMSRGAMLAAGAVFIVYLWRSRANWRVGATLVMLSAVILGLVAAYPAAFSKRVDETEADRGAGRLDIWYGGLRAFQDHPIAGVGVDGFPPYSDRYRYLYLRIFDEARAPHNIYLGIAVELGAIGLALLLSFATAHFLIASRLFRSRLDGPTRFRLMSFEAACWGLLVCGFFLDLLWESYFWLAWMLLLMMANATTASRARSVSVSFAPPVRHAALTDSAI